MRPAVFVLALLVACATPTVCPALEDWVLAKEAGGASAYTREVAHSKLKAFRGEMEIGFSKELLMAIVRDVERWPLWMPDVAEVRVLEQAASYQTHYLHSELPWPVRDRDGVYRFDYEQSDGSSEMDRLRISAAPDAVPLVKGVIRIPHTTGFWQFAETEAGRTRVVYEAHVDPGGELPRWLINRMLASTPIETLHGLETEAQRRRTSSPD